MCGIVGLFAKTPEMEPSLGRLLAAMLVELSNRGPDSAGVAFYRNPQSDGLKVTLFAEDPAFDWSALGVAEIRGSHAVLVTDEPLEQLRARLPKGVRVMSAGSAIEIYKEKGLPAEVAARFRLDEVGATHALGHTRMATESAVTTEHSHPFSTGLDLCLVHNGSLSNHNRLREQLRRRGIGFETDNDTEVAAGYLTWRLAEGDSLEQALQAAIRDLDGFYTFAVGTKDGFAVLRDPIACKHAVLAETDDWVAMATEYRAIAKLPGARDARIWEPAPAQIYSWSRA